MSKQIQMAANVAAVAALAGAGFSMPLHRTNGFHFVPDAGEQGGSATAVATTPAPATAVKDLRTEYSTLHAAAEALVKKMADEGRDLNDAEKVESDKQFARMKEIKSIMDRQGQLAELAFTQKASAVQQTQNPPGAPEPISETPVRGEIIIRDRFDAERRFNRHELFKAFNQWARDGVALPAKFATITTQTASDLLLPTEVTAPIIPSAQNVFREALAVYDLNPWVTPTTRTINLPVVNAAAGGVVSETANSETENAPGFADSILSIPKTYQSGSVWFSMLEIMAVDFDLMDATLPSLVYSKELGLESDAISTIVGDSGITQSVATATVGGFTYGNLVSLNRALPKRFNGQKVIVLSKAAYTAAENLVTSTGFPILNYIDPQRTSLKFFNGTPVVWSDYLASFGANNVVGFIFSHIGLRVRDAGSNFVQRFTQNQARPGQTGFNYYGFHHIGYSDSAVAKLTCPAS